jgi:ATP-dependent Clp protease adaptor protein ClpS
MEVEEIVSPKESVSLNELLEEPKTLVIYNDDVNTFEHVIESLIKICKHDNVQAEQCTWIIHYKGKCAVKKGSMDKIKPMCEAFLDRGISAKIEE